MRDERCYIRIRMSMPQAAKPMFRKKNIKAQTPILAASVILIFLIVLFRNHLHSINAL